MPLVGELHDISVLISVLSEYLQAFLEGEEPQETYHSSKSRYGSLRRSLLNQINTIIDSADKFPGGPGADAREAILMDVITSDLRRWGIVQTEDGKMFTFAPSEGE